MHAELDASPSSTGERRRWLWAALLFLLALPPLVMRMDYPVEWGDEGFFANGALRVLAGEVVYRDFQHNYPPGRLFTLALAVAAFGQKMAVVHGVWVAFHAAAVAISFLVARRLMSTSHAVACALLVLANPVHQNKAAELFLAAAVLAILYAVAQGRRPCFLAGIGLGLVTLFRHDVAMFGVLLVPVALALRALNERDDEHPFLPRFTSRLRGLLPLLGGGLLVGAPFLLYLVVTGAFGAAWHDLVHSGYLANKLLAKPFPGFGEILEGETRRRALVYWSPIALYATGLLLGGFWLTREKRRKQGSLLLLTSLLGALLFVQVLTRTDHGHLNKAYVPAHLLGVYFAGIVFGAMGRAMRARRWLACVPLLVAAHGVGFIPFGHLVYMNRDARYSLYNVLLAVTDRGAYKYERVEFPHGELVVNAEGADEWRALVAELAPYADREGEEEEALLAFPAGANFNFLAGIPNPLPFDTLRPGELGGFQEGEFIANHPDKLAEMMRIVEETKPRFFLQTFEKTNPQVNRRLRGYLLRPESPSAPTYRYLECDYAILFVRNP